MAQGILLSSVPGPKENIYKCLNKDLEVLNKVFFVHPPQFQMHSSAVPTGWEIGW